MVALWTAVLPVGAGALPVAAVDPLVGTAGEGNTAPGPQVPFGFANPSPDTTSPSTAGYAAGLRVGARTLTIATTGARSAGVRSIASATLNGTPLRRAWLTHRELAGGGTLRPTLADHPTAWATRAQPPPSLTN